MGIKIGHIIHSYKPLIGGGEIYVSELIRAIDDAEHIVFQMDTGDRSVEVRPVRVWEKPIKSFRTALQFQYFRDLLTCDLLVSHDLMNFLPLFGPRTIGICHGVNWKNFQQRDKSNRRTFQKACRAWRNALGIVANDTNFFREMGISNLAPGERFYQEVEERRWLIPNCVDTEQFGPGPLLPRVRELNAIIVPRRVAPERGIDLAVEAFQHLHAERPDLTLLVVGDVGNTKYMDHIQELVIRHGLLGKIFFTGRVPHDKMPLLYRSSLLSLLPTLHSEGTSLSALESMACGCPTFSTAVGGLLDLPTIKVPMNPEEIARTILERLRDGEQTGAKQMETVRETFCHARWVAAWKAVISRCLAAREKS